MGDNPDFVGTQSTSRRNGNSDRQCFRMKANRHTLPKVQAGPSKARALNIRNLSIQMGIFWFSLR